MSAKDKGLQDRQADELNTPVENGLEADSDIISSRDRDVFLKQCAVQASAGEVLA